jgi:Sec-independent protein translocase protein TatA
MFGLSFTEIIVVMVISFLIFGPEQFPIMVKKAIKQISEFKRYISQAQNSFHDFTRDVEKEFDPNQWTGNTDEHSVSHDQVSEEEKKVALLASVSIDPNDYDPKPLDQWRWQTQPEGKPSDFDNEPFDWKAQASQN